MTREQAERAAFLLEKLKEYELVKDRIGRLHARKEFDDLANLAYQLLSGLKDCREKELEKL